jgi:hypothetical protein
MSHVLTVKEFSKKIQCKADLYEAVIRNGFYLPRPKSSIVTENYLVGVMDGTIWCPKAESIRLKLCPRPPPKNVLLDKFVKLMKSKNYNSGMVDGRQPDKGWLIVLISTLNPDDEIFKKDYLPPPKKHLIEE